MVYSCNQHSESISTRKAAPKTDLTIVQLHHRAAVAFVNPRRDDNGLHLHLVRSRLFRPRPLSPRESGAGIESGMPRARWSMPIVWRRAHRFLRRLQASLREEGEQQ